MKTKKNDASDKAVMTHQYARSEPHDPGREPLRQDRRKAKDKTNIAKYIETRREPGGGAICGYP